MAKPFSQLIKDVQKAGKEIARKDATLLVAELQDRGPYWDGYFANEWVVAQGDVDIPGNIQSPGTTRTEPPRSRDITRPQIPEPVIKNGRVTYTIGNRMEYRLIAMDIEPDHTGRYRYERNRPTAPRGWFETFNQGGDQLKITQTAVNTVMRSLGFGK